MRKRVSSQADIGILDYSQHSCLFKGLFLKSRNETEHLCVRYVQGATCLLSLVPTSFVSFFFPTDFVLLVFLQRCALCRLTQGSELHQVTSIRGRPMHEWRQSLWFVSSQEILTELTRLYRNDLRSLRFRLEQKEVILGSLALVRWARGERVWGWRWGRGRRSSVAAAEEARWSAFCWHAEGILLETDLILVNYQGENTTCVCAHMLLCVCVCMPMHHYLQGAHCLVINFFI